jgi:intracellular sulfur oxidation DsrE/DsrF family protein
MKGSPVTDIFRRAFVSLSALAALTLLAPAAAHAQSSPTKNKIVFQVSDGDPQKWGLALNNTKNAQDNLGKENVDIEIVVYGPGIGMLKDDSVVGNRVADAVKSGVKVVACETTMKAQKLTTADMLPVIGYVPAGVVELMKKQQAGYAYIRP